MAGIALKDFEIREDYFQLVYKQIMDDLSDTIYRHLYKINNLNFPKPKAINSATDVILKALKNEQLYYVDGKFKATQKFNATLSKALKEIGATWNSRTHSFDLPFYALDNKYIMQMNANREAARFKLEQINSFLGDISTNLDEIIETFVYDTQVKTILKDSENQIKKNIKKVNVVPFELDDKQLYELGRTYTNNLNLYIKDWTTEQVSEMREEVQKMLFNGAHEIEVQKFLEQRYGQAQTKAKFLAHQETSILLSQYKSTTYQEMGFNEFIWKTILDGKERELHKSYNNRVFSFKNKPIIDERTGERGLPGEAYGCRCSMIPFRNDNPFMQKTVIEGQDYVFV